MKNKMIRNLGLGIIFILFLISIGGANAISNINTPKIAYINQGNHILNEKINVPVNIGTFNWNQLLPNEVTAFYYPGWHPVIVTNGAKTTNTLSFPSLNQSPYTFPHFSSHSWSAVKSTLVYIKTGDKPLKLSKVLDNGKVTYDIVGIWWQTGWIGMATHLKPSPITIPPNQKAIIQINHRVYNLAIVSPGIITTYHKDISVILIGIIIVLSVLYWKEKWY